MQIESEQDFLERNKTHKAKVEALKERLEELKEQCKPLNKEIKKISKEIIALNKEKNRLNKERGQAIHHAAKNNKDKAAHTWYAVGYKTDDIWVSCGYEYYQTAAECKEELAWFKYMYPDKELKAMRVVRDMVNPIEAIRLGV